MTIRGYSRHLPRLRSSPRRLCRFISRNLCTRVSDRLAGGSVERSYRFGLRLGPDLVIALVVLCVLFVALEPGAEAAIAVGSGVDVAAGSANTNELRILHPMRGEH